MMEKDFNSESDLPITMDEPMFTFDGVMNAIANFLAVLGMVAVSIGVGLYFGGFFTWLMK